MKNAAEVCTLENEKLRIAVSPQGGELRSVYEKESGNEYLWQPDPQYWSEQAPNLFPYIARMTEKSYLYKGDRYQMQSHGLVKYRKLEQVSQDGTLVFALQSDEETKKSYPFDFVYRVHYQLEENAVLITYEVENTGTQTMYFGIGGHPGFRVPFAAGSDFEEYYLEFEPGVKPVKIRMSEDCFVLGEEPFEDLKENQLALSHGMFDHDAIILRKMGDRVKLKCKGAEKCVELSFPQMDYLGIWHKPHTDAPYVCLEPWSSLPSRKGIVEDLEKQENLVCLKSGGTYRNQWSINLGVEPRQNL